MTNIKIRVARTSHSITVVYTRLLNHSYININEFLYQNLQKI
jgi:hypothetical protein